MTNPIIHLAEYSQRLRTVFARKTIIRYYNTSKSAWSDLNGGEVADRCLDAAKALAREGIQLGDKVGFYTPNNVHATIAELGLYMMRGISVPLYATSTPEQVDFIVRDAQVRLIFVGEQFQYNNAYEVQRTIPELERIIIFDNSVVLHPEDKTSMYYDEFIRRGDSKASENQANISSSRALGQDIALIIYTSGTSGRSKGVVLRHSSLMCQIDAHVRMFDFISSRDVSMSFLPQSHIFEKTWVYYCLYMGCTVAILNDPKRILEALPQIKPTMMCNVPRFWEKVYAGVQDKINQAPPLQQKALRHAIEVGRRYRLEYDNEGRPAPWHLRLLFGLYKRTLFAKLKSVLGLQRGRFFPVAGASLSDEVNRFLQSVDIPICVGYGLSESTATVSCFPQKGFVLSSIGEVLEHVDVRIDPETSEIQLKGPSIITEYYNNPEANAESFTPDGYFKTGDAGRLEGRVLYFTERIKDLFKTANGKYIAPQMLEGLLATDPIFEQVAIIGDGYKFVSALIFPNWDILRREAQERGLNLERSNEALAEDYEVHRLVMTHVEQALGSVAQYEKVKKFTLLSRPFTIEDGELTSTMKIRRTIVAQHYAQEIAKMYEQ
ncbi:MAG: long-chain fatty acid--CoA ligase [Porphyromonadaceae bacterium]|nr:long-chain fatty acid--CoA ligase [Porphyromonadaceae bacterium]